MTVPVAETLPLRIAHSLLTDPPTGLEFDLHHRYHLAARLIDRLCNGMNGFVRVLEVGCNVLNLLPRFLDEDRVHVTRADVLPGSPDDPNYVQLQPGAALPFANGTFDVVIALEVLEHLPADQRGAFLAECVRISRRGCVWSCPNGRPEVEAAEEFASAAYQTRNGVPHPFLREHREFGLPREQDLIAELQRIDCAFAVFDQSPLMQWLPSIILAEPLAESQVDAELVIQLRQALEAVRPTDGLSAIPYRKFYVAARTFESTAALEPMMAPLPTVPSIDQPTMRIAVEAMTWLGAVNARVLLDCQRWMQTELDTIERRVSDERIRLDRDRQRFEQQQSAWESEQEQMLQTLHEEFETMHAEYRRASAERDQQRRETLGWVQRARVIDAALREFVRRPTSRLMAPLRWLSRKLLPVRRDDRALLTWCDLRPAADHEGDAEPADWLGFPAPHGIDWQSTGNDPQFVLPALLPPGWLRVRLHLTGEAQGQAELYADFGDGFTPGTKLDTFDWVDELDVDVVMLLPHHTRALRLDPLNGPGTFRIERFEVQTLPTVFGWWHALKRKWELLTSYHCLGRTLRRGAGMLLRGDIGGVRRKLLQAFPDDRRLGPVNSTIRTSYETWRRKRAFNDIQRDQIGREVSNWHNPPLITVLLPVYNTPPEMLEAAIESVLGQLYPHWELCICDDGSTASHVRAMLNQYAQRDPRIRLLFAAKNGGISAASNRALEIARGDFIALLDHDDTYAEHALLEVARAIREHPEADMIYSDEDKLDAEGRHIDPFFKPDWAPEFFLSCMYTCHLSAYRTAIVRRVGGFRSEFDLAQDYDLALRIVSLIQSEGDWNQERQRIHHIADVLYHWRMAATSTATGHQAKPQAEIMARRAVQAYLDRQGRGGKVERGPSPGLQRVRYPIQGQPKISIVLPTASKATMFDNRPTWFVKHCVESIRRLTRYRNYEIIVIDNADMPAELAAALDALDVKRVSFTAPFNLAEKMNFGADHASGEYLVLLNDDMEIISPDWLEAMLEWAQWPEIGVVGAKLFFGNGRIQHAGVTFVGPLPMHHFYNEPGEHPGYWGGNILVRNYSAVTGACMMTRTDLYRSIGGFDRAFPLNFNDIDYCMKVLRRGLRILMQPNAQLFHYESASKEGTFIQEIEAFLARWEHEWPCDPMYSPHLTRRETDYRLA